ncbi:MAG: adenylyl-sulfate reductase subunit beta [Candidatus Thiodiazotropha lotti]|uniref:Adenylylsulfate reductase subunit beta n=1 Tax=Candidatus Thiodiazotropha endoloripes TaxID=1818881 RepID=A0A1E2UM53_9GAMM|nr:adenylyl-sulfate reductase subunit beta [Candidatus Thiodiazotropha endoloripes]MCG7899672.1 adenylyl-sulfate reductase subunit beta [Candidatus Thiodiazotropha weberae]MCG7991673.1 adenylyl-sulfate reductase subunit beta [Candidatus Thiodiazotropha lotti]MCG7904340.1 adenylyl-sulfate reductase subunit beta [Candidatus Thiodiazotropha weberae]MCG7999697.1 adenylyl-sulfate reductase subunit beta [Candidatus Thiodiazotropha lotti]MCW4183328.1 adenylyl-sulfate reductase subunit beta [Candidatu
MPTFVRTEKCDGCKGQAMTACVYICPHDLMKLDNDGTETGHAMMSFNQEPDQCWECYSCVKICPQQAIEVRPYADIVPLGAMVQPLRGADSIMWSIKLRNGTMKRFKFPIRTTPVDSIDPYAGKPAADMAKIDEPGFFNHDEQNGYRAGDADELIRK